MSRRMISRVLLLSASLFLLTLSSCFTVPLGNPKTSVADPALRGFWDCRRGEDSMFVSIAPFDDHAYLIHTVDYKAGDEPQIIAHQVYKGWLTEIKGERFLTLQFLRQMALPDEDEETRMYPVLKVALDSGEILIRRVDQNFEGFKVVQTSGDLARVIEANLDNESMYEAQSMAFKRVDYAKNKEWIDKLLK